MKMEKIIEIPKLPLRKIDGHKGDFGKVCIIAGSTGFSGAAAIAGLSALRSGSGLVRLAVPKSILPTVASIEPCFTTIPLPDDSAGRITSKASFAVLQAAEENEVVAFGPGVGLSIGVGNVLEKLLGIDGLRMVIDAGGLNNIAKMRSLAFPCKASAILTPHPGEMKRLWAGIFRESLPADRIDHAAKLALATKTTVVLKGHETVVSNGQKVYVNTTGNNGMATAGSGDVLTGIITALCGQGLDNFNAAVLGVYIHGLAGDLAAADIGQISLIATDIIDYLPDALQGLEHKE